MVATEIAAQREVVRPQNKDEEKEEEEEAKVSSQVTALQWVFTKSGLISSHSNRSPTRSTNTNTHTHEESRQNGRARPLHRFTTVTLPHSMTRCECLRLCMCVSS